LAKKRLLKEFQEFLVKIKDEHHIIFGFFCFVLFAVLGFELRALCLQGRRYCLNHVSILFCSGYFRDRVLLFIQAGLDDNPILSFPP
jgi:hypothetical protein